MDLSDGTTRSENNQRWVSKQGRGLPPKTNTTSRLYAFEGGIRSRLSSRGPFQLEGVEGPLGGGVVEEESSGNRGRNPPGRLFLEDLDCEEDEVAAMKSRVWG